MHSDVRRYSDLDGMNGGNQNRWWKCQVQRLEDGVSNPPVMNSEASDRNTTNPEKVP